MEENNYTNDNNDNDDAREYRTLIIGQQFTFVYKSFFESCCGSRSNQVMIECEVNVTDPVTFRRHKTKLV